MKNINPYVSVDSLQFGKSTPENCIALYGKPNSIRKNRESVDEYEYDEFIFRFDPASNTLRECTLLPKAVARIQNLDVTWDRKFLEKACQQDGHPVDVYGFIVLPTLGIAVTGIHDDDRSQLAVTVFAKGEFDELIREGSPFEISRIS